MVTQGLLSAEYLADGTNHLADRIPERSQKEWVSFDGEEARRERLFSFCPTTSFLYSSPQCSAPQKALSQAQAMVTTL